MTVKSHGYYTKINMVMKHRRNGKMTMNCWHCNTELIWGGDHDTEDNEDYDIVSNLSCPNCHAAVDVWHPSEKLIKEYKDYEQQT